MKKIRFKIMLITILSFACCMGAKGEIFASSGCKDIEIIYARGTSGERLGTDEWRSLNIAVERQLGGSKLSYEVWDLDYPADGASTVVELLGTVFSGGEMGKFVASVELGAKNLKDYQKERLKICPNTQFLLVGYSQGAKVIARALDALDEKSVGYVAFLGDPGLYLPEGEGGWLSKACLGMASSVYRVYAPNCSTEKGLLGARKPYVPLGWNGKIGLWCNDKDLICGSSKNLLTNTGHVMYDDLGHFDRVVEIFCDKLRDSGWGALLPELKPAVKLNTVILIDTTGSMQTMIGKYKKEALRLAKQTLEKGGNVALYEYRDLGDPFVPRQLCDFSCSLEEFSEKLDKLIVYGGGDTAESLLSAALYAMRTLAWTPGANKSLVVLTDAPYLSPDRDGISQQEVVELSLKIDPVNFYIITEDKVKSDYVELAVATGGRVFGLDEMEVATDYIEKRPVALLPYEIYTARVGETVRFDASGSYGLDSKIVSFEWDLDNDGSFELGTGAVVERSFDFTGEYFVVMKAWAENGMFSTMSAKVLVMPDGDFEEVLGGSKLGKISGARLEASNFGNLRIYWDKSFARAEYVLLSLDENLVGYVKYSQGELFLTDLDSAVDHVLCLALMDADFNFGEFECLDWTQESEKEDEILAVAGFYDNGGDETDEAEGVNGAFALRSENNPLGVLFENDIITQPRSQKVASASANERGFLAWGWIILVLLAGVLALWILLGRSKENKKRLLYE